MGKVLEEISDELARWIEAQPMFFVASAPSDMHGHVNVSPKGLEGSFAVLGPRRVAYLDLTGSGIETVAHVRENGRITIMFCAFEGRPKICRLYGHGTVHAAGGPEFEALVDRFDDHDGRRTIIEVDVERVSSSCGFGVPLMDLVGHRHELTSWTDRKTADDAIPAYWARKNSKSIDGLPGMDGLPGVDATLAQ